jgi:hypothetical protein
MFRWMKVRMEGIYIKRFSAKKRLKEKKGDYFLPFTLIIF